MPKLDINSFIIELASLKCFFITSQSQAFGRWAVSEDNLQDSFLLLPRGGLGIELRRSGLAASTIWYSFSKAEPGSSGSVTDTCSPFSQKKNGKQNEPSTNKDFYIKMKKKNGQNSFPKQEQVCSLGLSTCTNA